MSFGDLPNELLFKIFDDLSDRQKGEIAPVCRRWWFHLSCYIKKVLVLQECDLSEGSEMARIFKEPLMMHTSLRLGEVKGRSFGSLCESVTTLFLENTDLPYHEALLVYFKNVTDLAVRYPIEYKYAVFRKVTTLRFHDLRDTPEAFARFVSCFPNVQEIYIESILSLNENILEYIMPYKEKIRALPQDILCRGMSSTLAFSNINTLDSTRILTDWRVSQLELVEKGFQLERPVFSISDPMMYEEYLDRYYKYMSEASIHLTEPMNVYGIKLKSIKVQLGDSLLCQYPSLLQCESLEVVAFSSYFETIPCFFGHRIVATSFKNLIIRIGSRKDCKRCWKALMRSCTLDSLHFHGQIRPFIFDMIPTQLQLRKLYLQISPSDEMITFTWTPIPTLRELRIHFAKDITLDKLREILAAQPKLTALDVQGSGNFTGIIDSILQLHELRFLTLYVHENLLDLERLTDLKILKYLKISDDVCSPHKNGPTLNIREMFRNSAMLLHVDYLFRKFAVRMWRRLHPQN